MQSGDGGSARSSGVGAAVNWIAVADVSIAVFVVLWLAFLGRILDFVERVVGVE